MTATAPPPIDPPPIAPAPVDPDLGGKYDSLDPQRITSTIRKLRGRIEYRFPDANLGRVCGRLLEISESAAERSRQISRPDRRLRAALWGLVGAIAVSVLATAILLFAEDGGPIAKGSFEEGGAAPVRVAEPDARMGFADLIQVLEAGINDVVLIGAAIFFLVTVENRIKRHRALAAIHELRAMAHIVDMHQLTKDPEQVSGVHVEGAAADDEELRPRLTPFQLNRYLDYCSDMLSLIGKIAALYVQQFDDPAALAAVNEVENLCTGLSRKIWQKIMLVDTVAGRGRGS